MLLAALLTLVTAPSPAPQEPEPCRIHGTLVDDAGQPVAGATVSVNGWSANNDREREFGRPKNWTNPPALVTEEDGRFEFEFVPPQAYQFVVDVQAPGRGKVGWRWGRVKHGEELDLGRTVLEPEAILVGYILDADGTLLADGWRVTAWHSWNSGLGGRSTRSAHATVDPASGRFRIEGLPPGELRVTATRGSAHIPEAKVTTKLGEDTELVLRYEGPDVDRRLVVTVFSRPFYPFRPAAGSVVAIGRDGVRHPLVRAPGRANDWHVLDLEPGAYRVEFTDPRFEELTLEELRTGGTGRAMLKGSAALRVAVVNGETGEPVTDFSLDVAYTGVNFSPNVFRILEAGAPPPPGGLHQGIVPADLDLVAKVEGWPEARAAVTGLQPGETREVEVRLSRGVAIEGRVVDERGAPLGGVTVELTRGAYPGHSDPDRGATVTHTSVNGQPTRIEIGYRDAAATTLPDGSFRFEGLAVDTYSLLALRGPSCLTHEVVTVPVEAPVELTLPDSAVVTGSVQLPDGVAFDRIILGAQPAAGREYSAWRSARRFGAQGTWTPDEEGRIPPREFPLGEYELTISRSIEQVFGESRTRSTERIGVRRIQLDSDAELTLDLRETYPVPISLRLELPSEGLKDGDFHLFLELIPAGEEERVFATSETRIEGSTFMVETSGPPRELEVQLSGLGFTWPCGGTIRPERGASNRFEVTAPLVHRSLAVRDASGAALASKRIALWGPDGPRIVRTLDDSGEVALLRPAGSLSIAPLPPPDEDREDVQRARKFGFEPPVDPEVLKALEPGATVEFTAGDDPLMVELSAGETPL